MKNKLVLENNFKTADGNTQVLIVKLKSKINHTFFVTVFI